MNLARTDEHDMLRDSFARSVDTASTMAGVRASLATGGFDVAPAKSTAA